MNLADLHPAGRDALLASANRIRVARGAAVYLAGDAADRIYFVADGRAKIVRAGAAGTEAIVGIRAQGDVLGEMAGFGRRVRVTSAIAIEPLELDALAVGAFRAALAADAALARAFARGLARRLSAAGHELAELLGKSVAGRLVDGLGRLAHDHGVTDADGTVRIGISLTQQDLADYIGTSRETVTKELGVLADVGLLRVTHKTVTLIQPRAFPFAGRREAR
jgi:CRP/FNR family transcriptional regulator